MITMEGIVGGMRMETAKKAKYEWISIFRDKGEKLLTQINSSSKSKKDKALDIHKKIKTFRDEKIAFINEMAESAHWSKEILLNEILLLTYASYIVMLECRNKIWHYEYMAFSRRIGELWEPFCKLPFEYPIKPLSIITPPDFKTVQSNFMKRAFAYINALNLSNVEKEELNRHYNTPWELVDSGEIKLALDLHFKQDGINYNCDFKSGFSSNEKGNTNRLLLVASIYKLIDSKEQTLLFVRQREDENNHYLQKLKDSQHWKVYCADECYAAIYKFTGFNLREWLDKNVDWSNDISPEFRDHLQQNDLLKYLTW